LCQSCSKMPAVRTLAYLIGICRELRRLGCVTLDDAIQWADRRQDEEILNGDGDGGPLGLFMPEGKDSK
jgi:hypothetical protein